MTATANQHLLHLESGQQRRDALLGGVAEAARRLLAIADFDAAVNGALEAISTAAEIDRIYILENYIEPRTGEELGSLPYEWTAPDVVKAQSTPGRFPMSYADFGDWLERWKAGESIQALARDLSAPARELQKKDEALSLLTVPIRIHGHLWGVIGFDDCTRERVWSEAEIAVLETAAASFAGALQRREYLAELERRDALLDSVNAAAQCLVANDELEQALPKALRILGEGTQQDRVYVFRNVPGSQAEELFWEMPFEWNAPGIPSSVEYGVHLPVPMSAFPCQMTEAFLKGQAFHCLVRDLDGIALNLNQDAQALSLVGVPIIIEGQPWGLLGFDDCRTERIWSDVEIAVLETAAACVGSAIERDLACKEREAGAQARTDELEVHNQELAGRDRILTATAEASNILQTEDNFDRAVNTAIRVLGESIGCDRAFVAQQFDDPTGETLGFLRLLYEWDSPGISSQTHDYEGLQDISWEEWGIVEWFHRNVKGEAFGETIDNFSERFHLLQDTVGTQAVHNIPIFVEGQFWGAVGTDHCREKKLLTEAELAAFKTAANCIGNAIERDRTRKDREAAAKARAEELSQVNGVLKDSLSRLASEPDLNVFLGACHRQY